MLTQLVGRAYAAVNLNGVGITPIQGGTLTQTVTTILTWLFGFAGIIAVIYLIYGGILYITAGGDAEKATKGRTALVNAIIGIVIIALAIMIVRWVSSIVNTGTA
jgi:hypothetical protein